MLIGLFGKTNVGKSTFFAAATQAPVKIGNFPFTTIAPNTGIAYVNASCPCKHFKIKHENPFCINGTRLIPIKIVDVAGLVPGASSGKGLGNKFLDDASKAKILIHVVDISGSTDSNGIPKTIGSYNPIDDIKFIENELEAWFKQILIREWKNLINLKNYKIDLVESIYNRFSGLSISKSEILFVLNKLKLLSKNPHNWNDDEIEQFLSELRKKTKPILIAANKADLCADLKIVYKITHADIMLCSAATELILRKAKLKGFVNYEPWDHKFAIIDNNMSNQQMEALQNVKVILDKINSTGIQNILNKAVFDILNWIVVYPVENENSLSNKSNVVLPDAKLLPPNSTVKDLAYEIHADLGRGFLYAIDVKTKKRISDDYKLQNNDVIKIVSRSSRK